MSFYESIQRHEHREELSAKAAVKCIQSGDRYGAELFMADAATSRHLAYELRDTWQISLDALRDCFTDTHQG